MHGLIGNLQQKLKESPHRAISERQQTSSTSDSVTVQNTTIFIYFYDHVVFCVLIDTILSRKCFGSYYRGAIIKGAVQNRFH